MSTMNCRRAVWSRLARSFTISLCLPWRFWPVRPTRSLRKPFSALMASNSPSTASRPFFWASAITAASADDETWRRDFDKMQTCGFNWVRVWATWSAFGGDWAAVDPTTGKPRQPFLASLEKLVAECDRRGLVVDVTLCAASPDRGRRDSYRTSRTRAPCGRSLKRSSRIATGISTCRMNATSATRAHLNRSIARAARVSPPT